LREVGAWLQANGEAIYDTRPWKRFGEGPTQVAGGAFQDANPKPFTPGDFRFTTRGTIKLTTVYAIELGWPSDGRAIVRSLGTDTLGQARIRDVSLLGSPATLKWQQRADRLDVELPAQR